MTTTLRFFQFLGIVLLASGAAQVLTNAVQELLNVHAPEFSSVQQARDEGYAQALAAMPGVTRF